MWHSFLIYRISPGARSPWAYRLRPKGLMLFSIVIMFEDYENAFLTKFWWDISISDGFEPIRGLKFLPALSPADRVSFWNISTSYITQNTKCDIPLESLLNLLSNDIWISFLGFMLLLTEALECFHPPKILMNLTGSVIFV